MFWLRNKKIIFLVHTLNLRPGNVALSISYHENTYFSLEVSRVGEESGGLDCPGNYKLLYVSLEIMVQTPSKSNWTLSNWSLGSKCFSRDVRMTLCEIV